MRVISWFSEKMSYINDPKHRHFHSVTFIHSSYDAPSPSEKLLSHAVRDGGSEGGGGGSSPPTTCVIKKLFFSLL
jgi:hypothetical protein